VRASVPAAVLTALLLALSATGCGSDSSSTQVAPLTTREWRGRANAICRDIGSKVRRVRQPTTLVEITPFVAAVVPLWRQQEDRIRALEEPEGLASPVRDYLTALSYLEASLVEIHIATERNDGGRRGEAVDKSQRAALDMRYRARILGLSACARQRIP
jgi:hypothetical protein